MSWSELQLGEAIHVKHGFAFKGEFFAGEGSLMVVTPGNFLELGGFRVRVGKERFYTSDFPESYLLAKDDLIVAMTEQGEGLLGSAARIPEDDRCLHNQRIGLVTVTEEARLDKRFLYWLFNSKPVRAQIRGSSTGTKVRHTAPERIYKVRVNIPDDVNEQAKIAEILDRYNDLIETNQRRIELLDESARLLYREWFINFRFPGYETAHKIPSELGDIPHGWKVVSLDKVCSRVTDGAHKSPPTEEDGCSMASVKDMRDFDIDVGKCRKISEKNYDELVQADCKVVKGDILVAKDGSYLKHIFECGESEDVVLLSSIAMLRPNSEIVGCFLMYALKSPDVNFRMRQCVSGVAIPRIVLKDFRNFKILLPPLQIQQEWADIAGPMVRLCRELVRQNDALKASRDLLLPQLMSGAIQV